jgi:hypothetical protein
MNEPMIWSKDFLKVNKVHRAHSINCKYKIFNFILHNLPTAFFNIMIFRVMIKLTLCLTKYHGMKTYSLLKLSIKLLRCISGQEVQLHTYNTGTRWRWVVSFMPWLLCLQKSPQYPLDRRLGGPLRYVTPQTCWTSRPVWGNVILSKWIWCSVIYSLLKL